MKIQLKNIDQKMLISNKRFLFGMTVLLIMILNFILASCGTARRGEPVMGKIVATEQAHKGEIIFMENCQKCHPGGEAGKGPAINNLPLPGFALRFRVRSKAASLGVGRMPSFKKHEISKEELDNLVAYLGALKKNDEDAQGSTRGKKDFAKK